MECGIVSDVAFWQVLWCEHIIILFWYVRNVRTGREERIGKEKFEMRGRLAKAVEIGRKRTQTRIKVRTKSWRCALDE